MKLIVGLGNPGQKYENTRHNIGFMIVSELAKKLKCKFQKENDFEIAKRKNVVLLKPLTYMNLSGKAVKKVLMQNDIEDFMIVFDDINLSLGQIRLRDKGSDGGHNGIKSIITETRTDKFKRFRVGIDSNLNQSLSDYVLSEFDNLEHKVISESIELSVFLLEEYIFRDYRNLLNKFSKSKLSYSEKINKILESSDQRRKLDE